MSRILVVDDTPSNVKVMRTLLTVSGYDVTVAETGQQAIDMIAVEPPDLVLLDVVLPGMNGFEVCRRFRELPQMRSAPIVMVTASMDLDRERAVAAGANDMVMKPIESGPLLALIRSLID